MTDRGGGASRSTDPAMGSSTATDVSLREYLDSRIDALFKHLETLNVMGHAAIEARIAAVETAAGEHVTQLRRERELVTAAQAEAIAKADAANEKRFESVNEFRAQLSEQTASFIPREVAEAQAAQLSERLALVETAMAQNTGRQTGIGMSAGVVVGAITVIGTVLGIVIVLANVLTGS